MALIYPIGADHMAGALRPACSYGHPRTPLGSGDEAVREPSRETSHDRGHCRSRRSTRTIITRPVRTALSDNGMSGVWVRARGGGMKLEFPHDFQHRSSRRGSSSRAASHETPSMMPQLSRWAMANRSTMGSCFHRGLRRDAGASILSGTGRGQGVPKAFRLSPAPASHPVIYPAWLDSRGPERPSH
jgi:hypothetical protein